MIRLSFILALPGFTANCRGVTGGACFISLAGTWPHFHSPYSRAEASLWLQGPRVLEERMSGDRAGR